MEFFQFFDVVLNGFCDCSRRMWSKFRSKTFFRRISNLFKRFDKLEKLQYYISSIQVFIVFQISNIKKKHLTKLEKALNKLATSLIDFGEL